MKPYYEEAGITIYHGECREVLPHLSADLVLLTDPPYGIAHARGGGGNGWARKTFIGSDLVTGDREPFQPAHLLGYSKVILFGANHYSSRLPDATCWIIWDKREGKCENDFADCELIWTNLGGPARVFSHLWNGADRASERGEERQHPTQKPLRLMTWIISRWSKPDDVICDPYMGSGTTLRAAKDLGRRAIGIEIEEKYCEIAAKRLAQGVLPLAHKVA